MPAADAVQIDTTELDVEDVVSRIEQLVRERQPHDEAWGTQVPHEPSSFATSYEAVLRLPPGQARLRRSAICPSMRMIPMNRSAKADTA